MNLSNEVQKLPAAPVIVVLTSLADSKQYFVVAEKEVLLESVDMRTAMVDLIATYFTFDIAYPKPLYSLLLFIQHHIFSVVDSQPQPNIMSIVYTSLENLTSP